MKAFSRHIPKPARGIALLALGAALMTAVPALAGPSPQRTVLVHNGGRGAPNGPSSSPDISADGRFIAFTSSANNLALKPARKIANVYLYNQNSGAITLLSTPARGGGADGASSAPSVSADGKVVAFVSAAHNLAAGSLARARKEIFVWTAGSGVSRVSVGVDGTQANGDCGEPDVSGDGRLVVFSCAASNLAPGAGRARRNVYLRDLAAARTTLVSAGPAGSEPNGDSGAPAISPDGGYVSFSSGAPNVIPGAPANKKPQVLLRNLASGATKVVSVASNGQFQNASVKKPFSQLSDVSAGGRRVVFDSDATNLVPGRRRHHTEVLVRDTAAGKTSRASLATTDQRSNSDSFAPRISADGRYVTFESFATNLTPGIPLGGNVFVRDLMRRTTVMADVSSRGKPRGPEHVKQLLQRPSISDDGSTAAFESSARNLELGQRIRFVEVFLRRLSPAPITFASRAVFLVKGRVVVTFSSSDRQAGPLLCRLDRRPLAICPLGRTVLPRLKKGRHVLQAFAGGQGTAYAALPITVALDLRHRRPRARVTNPSEQLGLGR